MTDAWLREYQTVAEARKILAGRLVFGDPAHIAAVRLVNTLHELETLLDTEPEKMPCGCDNGRELCDLGHLHRCKRCDGSGIREYDAFFDAEKAPDDSATFTVLQERIESRRKKLAEWEAAVERAEVA